MSLEWVGQFGCSDLGLEGLTQVSLVSNVLARQLCRSQEDFLSCLGLGWLNCIPHTSFSSKLDQACSHREGWEVREETETHEHIWSLCFCHICYLFIKESHRVKSGVRAGGTEGVGTGMPFGGSTDAVCLPQHTFPLNPHKNSVTIIEMKNLRSHLMSHLI